MKKIIDIDNLLNIDTLKSKITSPKKLSVIVLGDNNISELYIRNKERFLKKVGLDIEITRLPTTSSTAEVIQEIYQISLKKDVNGITVQLPLPTHIDEDAVIESIPPSKDVDGLTNMSLFRLGTETYPYFLPCTARAVLQVLESENMCHDKTVAILGRSKLVGRPLAVLLSTKKYNDTVILCHSHTHNLKQLCRTADVIITAIGVPNYINDDFIGKSGVLVIDVGMNFYEGKIVGDTDFDNIGKEYDIRITPFTNGISKLAVGALALNLIES